MIPGVGRSIRTMALARMSWTLSLALEAGIDAGRAIRLSLQSTQLNYFTQHIPSALSVVERGGQFHEAVERTGAFPAEFVTALQNAELSGTESESLSRMSADYQRQAETATTTLTVIASMTIWALIGVMLVVVIFYLFFTLYLSHINEALEMVQ